MAAHADQNADTSQTDADRQKLTRKGDAARAVHRRLQRVFVIAAFAVREGRDAWEGELVSDDVRADSFAG